MSEPQFFEDDKYSAYLSGGERRWTRVRSDTSRNNKEKHQYLIHFGEKSFVDLEDKSRVEKSIQNIGGCFGPTGDKFQFDKHAHYLAHNTYVVFCEENAVRQLKNQQASISWIGAWVPEYKYTSIPQGFRRNTQKHESLVTLVGVSTKEESREIASKFNQALKALVPASCDVEVTSSSAHLLQVTVASTQQDDVSKALELVYSWLVHQSNVHWIEEKQQMKLLNHNAAWIVQSNTLLQFPIYDEGLDGTGQIVGCADSGIDYDHCFFTDPNNEIPLGTTNLNHRKVVSYRLRPSAVYGDDIDGHGTHVVGSIIGNPTGSGASAAEISAANDGVGVGRGAKISFLGLSPGGGTLDVPNDLDDGEFFQDSYNDGAKIHSDSWGCFSEDPTDCNVYSTQARDVDKYMYDHQDFLIVFAAGNSGDGPNPGQNTVGSPATAKNCLTVGASMNDYVSWANITKYIDFQSRIVQCCEQLCGVSTATCTCCPTTPEACCTNNAQPFCCPESMQKGIEANPSSYDKENLADFSSEGPGNLGSSRMKPDIIAPGDYIVSAHSDGQLTTFQCGSQAPALGNSAALFANRGTSMAAPVASGAAAIVRQYFTMGYYPSGSPTSSDVRNPSGSLLKAMLICSAFDLTGRWDDASKGDNSWEAMPPSPSFQQGWGKIELDRVLYFSGSVSHSLFIDDSTNATTGSTKTYTIGVTTEQKSLAITLVWTDPPGAVSSSKPLVNNLDLVVTSPGGVAYNGNDAGYYRSTVGSGFVDTENNVEKVVVSLPEAGDWTITVKGTNVPVGNQPYSLVASASPEEIIRRRTSGWVIFVIVLVVAVAVVAIIAAGFIYAKRRRQKFNPALQDPLLQPQ